MATGRTTEERPTSDEGTAGGDAGASTGEYVLGGLGGVLVAVLLAFLGYHTFAVQTTAPAPVVQVTGVVAAEAGYEVRFEVVNDGGRTAEDVQVLGEVIGGDGAVEEASATIGYVPPDSRRSGVLVFAADPREGRLQVRPAGYALP